jgi:hypothetical protein
VRHDYTNETRINLYFASIFYVLTTITTTGYGDIVPMAMDEVFLTILLTCIGVIFYSYIYSEIISSIEKSAQT